MSKESRAKANFLDQIFSFHLSGRERFYLMLFWTNCVASKDREARRSMNRMFDSLDLDAIELLTRTPISLDKLGDKRDEYTLSGATVDYMMECLNLPIREAVGSIYIQRVAGQVSDRLLDLKNGCYKVPGEDDEPEESPAIGGNAMATEVAQTTASEAQ